LWPRLVAGYARIGAFGWTVIRLPLKVKLSNRATFRARFPRLLLALADGACGRRLEDLLDAPQVAHNPYLFT
jgi:hypothetical protein